MSTILNEKKYNLYRNIDPTSYLISYCSSNDPNFSIVNIRNTSSQKHNKGWLSIRESSYPQYIILQFYTFTTIKRINFIFNHERVSRKINLYTYSPNNILDANMSKINEELVHLNYEYIGSIIPYKPEGYDYREMRKIDFLGDQKETKYVLYLKIELEKNYEDKEKNPYNQVGIVSIEIYGYETENYLNYNIYDKADLFFDKLKHKDDEYDPLIQKKIYYAKQRYYNNHNELNDKDYELYKDIDTLRYFGDIMIKLNNEKIVYIAKNDFTRVNQINKEINDIKNYVNDNYVTYEKEVELFSISSCYDETPEYNRYLIANGFLSNNKSLHSDNSSENNNNSNNNISIVSSSPVNEVSKQIMERRRRKLEMIQNSKENAKQNIRKDKLEKLDFSMNVDK